MSFQGDLSTIGLSEVFQMISMSQKEGTLVVQDVESRKSIFFGKDGIQVLSTGKRKGMRLGDLLVRAGKISEFRLQQVLESAKQTKTRLGDALVESGFVTRQDIDDVVRLQIEEEIYDLFLWPKAAFEFIEGEPAEELRDPDQPVIRLEMDVNSLLLEALRRVDEWQLIRKKIPGMECVFAFPNEAAKAEADRSVSEPLRKVLRNVDGINPVSEIVERSGLPKFDVCRALVEQLDAGRVRLLSISDLVQSASRRLEEGRRDAGFKLFESALASAPGDPEVLSAYAKALENEGLSERSAAQYAAAAKRQQEQGNLDAARNHLQRAAALNPKDAGIRTDLYGLLVSAGDVVGAAPLGEELARAAIAAEDYETGRSICDRMIQMSPRRTDFRILLARILHRTGKRNELEEEVRFLQKNLPPNETEANRILKLLSEFMPGVVEHRSSDSAIRRRKKGKRRILLYVFLLLLVGLAAVAGKYEWDARTTYEETLGRSQSHFSARRHAEARQELEEFAAGPWRFSFLTMRRMRDDLTALNQKIDEFELREADRENRERQEAQVRMEELDRDIRADFVRGDLGLAQNKVEQLEGLASKYKNGEYLQKVQSHRDEINRYLGEASRLNEQAVQLVDQGKYREAAKRIEDLRLRFRNSPVARNSRYPLCLFVSPDGVQVFMNGVDMGVVKDGRKVVYLPAEDRAAFRLTRKGYLPKSMNVTEPAVGEIRIALDQKEALWSLADGSVSPQPRRIGDLILICGRSEVVALGPDSRAQWRETVEGGVLLPALSGRRLVFGSGADRLIVLDPSAPAEKRIEKTVTLSGRLRAPAVLIDETLFYACEDKTLTAAALDTGAERWKAALPFDVPFQPAAAEGRLLLCGSDGSLSALDAERGGDLVWKYSTDSAITAPPWISGGVAYLGTTDGRVHAISLSGGKPFWRDPVALRSEITARLSGSGDLLFVPCKDGKLRAVRGSDGAIVWTFSAEGLPLGPPTAEGESVYFGGDDRKLYRVQCATGTLAWKFQAKEKIRTQPQVSGGIVCFGSEDGTLYGVAVD